MAEWMQRASAAVWLGVLLAAGSSAGVMAADTPETLMERYAAQAKAADPAFERFAAERGRAFYPAGRATGPVRAMDE